MQQTRIWLYSQIAFLVLVGAGLAACGTESGPPPEGVPPDAERLASRLLLERQGETAPYHEHAGSLYVAVLERSPGSGCGSFPELTAPVAAVAIRRKDGPVTWVELSEMEPC